jgi:hypothetical protein
MSEVIAYKEPRTPVGLAAKLPAMYLPNEKAAERFFSFFTRTSATRTRGGPITRQPAGFGSGAKAGD